MLIGPSCVRGFIFFFVLFGFSDKVCLMIGLYDKVDPSIHDEQKKYEKLNLALEKESTAPSSPLSPLTTPNDY